VTIPPERYAGNRFHAVRGMPPPPAARSNGAVMPNFQAVLRRLAMLDEAFVCDRAGLRLGPAGTRALDARTASLLQLAVSVALGSPEVCLEWCAARALAAGATEDEIADMLLVIAPVAGLGPVVGAAPAVATALGYDVAAALEDPGGQ
jgi:4-carboxymuconolactone decarboxylase